MKNKNQNKKKKFFKLETIDKLTNAVWDFAYQMLWDKIPYSKDEIFLIKIYIQELIADALLRNNNPIKLFSAFTRRILMSKVLFSKIPISKIPFPATFFNKRNPNGFASIKTNGIKNIDIKAIKQEDKSIVNIQLPQISEINFQIYLS
ncbi:MAG: hypothetical protein WC223_05130 [Bacteroidales bacterium]|jgi:hypothetical protein